MQCPLLGSRPAGREFQVTRRGDPTAPCGRNSGIPWGSLVTRLAPLPHTKILGRRACGCELNWELQPLCSLSWPGGGQERLQPFWPLCLVPREQLGPWNTLSLSVTDGMMERRVFLTAKLMDRALSKTWEDTPWEGGDQSSLGLGAPQTLWMCLGLQGGHLSAFNPEEGLAVSTFTCAWPQSCSLGAVQAPVAHRDHRKPSPGPLFFLCLCRRGVALSLNSLRPFSA